MRLLLIAALVTCAGCKVALPPPTSGTLPAVAERCGADIDRNVVSFDAELGVGALGVIAGNAGWVANTGHNYGLTEAMGITAGAATVMAVALAIITHQTAADYVNDGCASVTGPVPHPSTAP